MRQMCQPARWLALIGRCPSPSGAKGEFFRNPPSGRQTCRFEKSRPARWLALIGKCPSPSEAKGEFFRNLPSRFFRILPDRRYNCA